MFTEGRVTVTKPVHLLRCSIRLTHVYCYRTDMNLRYLLGLAQYVIRNELSRSWNLISLDAVTKTKPCKLALIKCQVQCNFNYTFVPDQP